MVRILLIEDDLDDIELLEDALRNHHVPYEITALHDGNEAIEHFKINNPPPQLIILDLNLPKVHGKEVLKKINSIHEYKNVPLLILTTSSSKDDIEYCYKYGADKYLIKPVSIDGIREMVETIRSLARAT